MSSLPRHLPQAAILILLFSICVPGRGSEATEPEHEKVVPKAKEPAAEATPEQESAAAAMSESSNAGQEHQRPAKPGAGKPKTEKSGHATDPVASAHDSEAKGIIALGNRLTDHSDYQAAEIAYRQILNSTEFSENFTRDAQLGLGRMHRLQGSYTKAAAIYEKFLKDYPDDSRIPDALLDLGRTQRAMGAYRMAINRFYSVINSTLKVQAENFDHYQLLAKTAQYEIAETYFASGDYQEAGKFFSRLRLLDLAPVDRARAHFKAACALQLSGDLEGAVATLHDFMNQWPQDENVPEARYLLATTLRQLKRSDEAMNVTLALLREAQNNPGADAKRWSYWQRRTGNQLANEFFQNGDTINALAIYQGLAALAPEPSWRLPVVYQTALCYERLRLTDRARTAYQTIVTGVSELAANKNGPPVPAELTELAHMAGWRMENLEWNDRAEQQLTLFFSTSTGHSKPNTPATSPTPVPTTPEKPTP